jgi:hypothetical protein
VTARFGVRVAQISGKTIGEAQWDRVPPAAAPSRRTDHPGANILLVDEENAVRAVTADMLREMGYVVLEAGSGGAALEVIESRRIGCGSSVPPCRHCSSPGMPITRRSTT